MTRTATKISLADLSAAGICLLPSEAVAIVRDVLLQVIHDDLPGVPSAHVIRLTAAGDILIEGPVVTGGPQVPRAAHLLEAVLAAEDLPPDTPVPGALRLTIARGLGTIDLPRYATLDAFARALQRFASPDVTSCVVDLCAAYASAGRLASFGVCRVAVSRPCEVARKEEPLTVADIRRARRSTRLSLDDVSERSRIPAWLLQELEWGDFRHWPGGVYGRTQLIRYARGAGLDEALVIKTVWPLIEDSIRARVGARVVVDDVPSRDSSANVAHVIETSSAPPQARPISRWGRWFATGAAVLLFAGGAIAPHADTWFTERHETAPITKSPSKLPAATRPQHGVALCCTAGSRPSHRSAPAGSRNRRSSTATNRPVRRSSVLPLRVTVVGDSSFPWSSVAISW